MSRTVNICGEDLNVHKSCYAVDGSVYYTAAQWCHGGALVWYSKNADLCPRQSRFYESHEALIRDWEEA